MKKCLITGASGKIGLKLIVELLKEKDYEITALDLKNNKSIKELSKYKEKINVVYSDINNEDVLKDLIKENEIIFHLAGIIPPSCELHPNLANIVDYGGSKSIIDLIKKVNPTAYFIYPSATTIYGDQEIVNIDSEINIYNDDYYSQNKYKIEDYIAHNLKNYTIYRIPLVLNDDSFDNFMFNLPINTKAEVVTDYLVASALSKTPKHKRELNKKTYILSGGKKYQTTTNELLVNVLKIQGMSFKYLIMRHSIPHNFYTHIYEDSDALNEILKFQTGSVKDVYKKYKKLKRFKRCINRLLAYITIKRLSK